MLLDFIRTHKVITVLVSTILVVFLGFGLFVMISRTGKEPVTIHLLPSDIHLTVDGKTFGTGTVYLTPGTHAIEASREGFSHYKTEITIGQPNTTVIDIALIPESDEALQWQKDHQQLYTDFQARADERATEEGIQFYDKNPIVNELPFKSYIFKIGYHADPDDPSHTSIILDIDAIVGYREAALDKIREFGFDPTDFKINFRNYENPFSHE